MEIDDRPQGEGRLSGPDRQGEATKSRNANGSGDAAGRAVTPVLAARDIGKRFPGVIALDGVDLDVYAGEVHALVGENGAGKSTLMKILSGIHVPDDGKLFWRDEPLTVASPVQARRLGLAIVHQEFNLVGPLSVAENLFLTDFPGRLGLLDRRAMASRAREVLGRLQLPLDVYRTVDSLSVAEKQLVEIARALTFDCKLLIMDEPSAALNEIEVERLFGVIGSLTGRGVAVVYISHKLDEVFRIADRITVLRDGRQVGTGTRAHWTRERVVTKMVGRKLENLFPKRRAQLGEPALDVRRVHVPGRLAEASFRIRSGEIVGVAGLMGAGQETLARALFGLVPEARGEIRIKGRPVAIRSPRDAIRHRIGLVTADRKQEGLVMSEDVTANVTLAAIDRFCRHGVVQKRRQRSETARLTDRMRIKASSPRQQVGTLSGGNQQKVVLAKWLATEPHVLILMEPTRGVDVGAKAEIYELMNRLVKEGHALLVISSELPEVIGMSDRILVMASGRLVKELAAGAATQETIMTYATGGGARG